MSIDYLAHEIGTLFIRLADRYGTDWSLKWAERDPHAMVRAWRDELQAFAGSQQYVAAIFDGAMRNNLPDRPVNAPQFRRLCEQARDTLNRQKHAPAGYHVPVRGPTPEEAAQLRELRDRIAKGGLFERPGTAWAQRVVYAFETQTPLASSTNDKPPGHYAYRMAREVIANRQRLHSPATDEPTGETNAL